MSQAYITITVPVPEPGQGQAGQLPAGQQPGRPTQPIAGQPPGQATQLPGGVPPQAGQLPSTDEAFVLVYSPRSGYRWATASEIIGGARPDHGLPSQPGHPSGGPVPPQAGQLPGAPPQASNRPGTPGALPVASQQPQPTPPPRPGQQPTQPQPTPQARPGQPRR